MNVNTADKMYQSAVGSRGNYNQQCTEAAEIASPRDRLFQESQTEGTKLRIRQFDTLTEHIHDRATNKFVQMTSPKHKRYSGFASTKLSSDENKVEDQRALDDIEETIFDARYRPKGGFSDARNNSVRSFLGYGNGVMFIDKGPDRETPITYRYCHLANTHFIVDGLDNIIGVFFSRKMGSHQIVKEFGEDKVPLKILELSKRETITSQVESREKSVVVHMVLENEDYNPAKKGIKHMKYISRHFVCGARGEKNNYLREGGYRVMPYAISRDAHMPHETYGRGTLLKILPEIKMRNGLRKIYIEAGHKAGRSTLLFKDDSSINMKQVRPGKGIVGGLDANGQPNVVPLNQGINMPILGEMMEELKQIVKQAFNADTSISNMNEERERITATEILTRSQEEATSLSYHAAIDEDQMQSSIVEREIDILDNDWGMLPRILDEVEEGAEQTTSSMKYKVYFKSNMTFAQKSDDVLAANRLLEAAQAVAPFDPTVVHTFKTVEYMKIVQEGNGVPAAMMATLKEYEAAVKKDQEREMQSQLMQNAGGLASGAQTILEGSPDAGAI